MWARPCKGLSTGSSLTPGDIALHDCVLLLSHTIPTAGTIVCLSAVLLDWLPITLSVSSQSYMEQKGCPTAARLLR